MSSYDVIVIGSGAGGGTLARHLAPSGKRILLLERGDWLPREPQNWSAADVFVENRYVSPDTWYDGEGKPFQPQVHYCVGGATKLYGAALYRLRKEDFGELRHHGGISPAWPIPYEQMEPYYTKAEQLYQVHGARGEDPTEPPAQRALPVPRGLARAPHPAALRRLRERGPAPLPRPLRRDARRAEHALQRVRALLDLRRLPLPRARQVRRRGAGRAPGARARQRHAADERDGRDAEHQPGGNGGHRGRRRARRRPRDATPPISIVVSCGAANTAKLLLRSANEQHPGGLANGSDQVGRNYMFHNSQAVLAISKEPNPTVFQKTLGVNDYYFASDAWEFPMGNIQMVGKSVAGDVPRREAADDQARADVLAGGGRRARGRLLALDRGSAAGREPRHRRRRRATLTLSYRSSNDTARDRLFEQLRSLLGQLGMHEHHLIPRWAYLENKIPVAGVAHQAGHLPASAPTRPPRC